MGSVNEFSYKEYPKPDNADEADRAIAFKEITYKKLSESVQKHQLVLMGFENLDRVGLTLNYIWNRRGSRRDAGPYQIDEKAVPSLVDADTNYCLVCKKEDMPSSLRGNFQKHPVIYEIDARDGVVRPNMKMK